MKQITIADVVGALCNDDYKGINNQYVGQGKVVIVEDVRGASVRSMEKMQEGRTSEGVRWNLWGGTESIVTEDIKAVDAKNFVEGNVNGTLTSASAHNTESNNVVRQQYAVRRLTPIEAERLQGLEDNFTLIDDKSCSDSARYKALGNGMAQPCADFVIRRIVEEVGEE